MGMFDYYMCTCVCVCVTVLRESDREREKKSVCVFNQRSRESATSESFSQIPYMVILYKS